MDVQNAKIQSVRLGSFEGQFWGAQICFDYGGCCQCVNFGIEKIRDLLKVLELPFWESLPGTNCRVKASIDRVFEIGHFMKERWLLIE